MSELVLIFKTLIKHNRESTLVAIYTLVDWKDEEDEVEKAMNEVEDDEAVVGEATEEDTVQPDT